MYRGICRSRRCLIPKRWSSRHSVGNIGRWCTPAVSDCRGSATTGHSRTDPLLRMKWIHQRGKWCRVEVKLDFLINSLFCLWVGVKSGRINKSSGTFEVRLTIQKEGARFGVLHGTQDRAEHLLVETLHFGVEQIHFAFGEISCVPLKFRRQRAKRWSIGRVYQRYELKRLEHHWLRRTDRQARLRHELTDYTQGLPSNAPVSTVVMPQFWMLITSGVNVAGKVPAVSAVVRRLAVKWKAESLPKRLTFDGTRVNSERSRCR